ncbi:hypothetical protein FQN60_014855 [Etheostoma spectabile]|uniref:Uncharacterized protein n=1 Tax=Etheostoma spectabile TaxID=54343 RepID=A0A5J5CPK7_9PERO|nr:hypothetical protein FQN60_014855 [Etheostoma spectabile]
MRNCTFGAKALRIRPPATITPLKMVTGRAPKLSTQALQTGPKEEEVERKTRAEKRDREWKRYKEGKCNGSAAETAVLQLPDRWDTRPDLSSHDFSLTPEKDDTKKPGWRSHSSHKGAHPGCHALALLEGMQPLRVQDTHRLGRPIGQELGHKRGHNNCPSPASVQHFSRWSHGADVTASLWDQLDKEGVPGDDTTTNIKVQQPERRQEEERFLLRS